MTAVYHALVTELPPTLDGTIAVGKAIWTFEVAENKVIFVEGTVSLDEGHLAFDYETPSGEMLHVFDSEAELRSRLKSYIRLAI